MFQSVRDTVQAGKDLVDGIQKLKNLEGDITDKRELNDLLNLATSAYSKTMEMQALYMDLLQEKEAILQENLKLKDWQQDQANYELHSLADNALVYKVKANAGASVPVHYLCTSCYQNHIKSILQADGHVGFERKLNCHTCKSYVLYRHADDNFSSVTISKEGWRRDF